MEQPPPFEYESEMIALNYAARLLLSRMDWDSMIQGALEGLADFGRSQNVGLFLLEEMGTRLRCRGGMLNKRLTSPDLAVELSSDVCQCIGQSVKSKQAGFYPLELLQGLPWPGREPDPQGRQCLCAPLVAADNRVIGVVTLEQGRETKLSQCMSQPMALFLTVAAVGLETARLFNLAVVDGLTGLYVRRYLDLRLNEEEARIRRYGGGVSIMMCDIDHFKKFNDAYGHARGDMVLKGVADILRESVRQDVDVVCRYGGEEFVVIMPNTSLHGAMVVAERICRRCREHPFPGPEAPLRVTLSGGSAHMDHDSLIPADLLLERADQALYRAKNAGRDQVLAWTSHNHQ